MDELIDNENFIIVFLTVNMNSVDMDQLAEIAMSFLDDGSRRGRRNRKLRQVSSKTCTFEDEVTCLTASVLNTLQFMDTIST
jgi:hypothetical protein